MTPLSTLASEIVSAQQAYLAKQRTALEHAVHVGRLLNEAKAQLPHGQWLPWLEVNCHLSPRVAQGYMRIADAWPSLSAAIANTKLSSYFGIRDALTILADAGTDPNELGKGGSDGHDEDDEDDSDGGCGGGNGEEDAHVRMIQLYFTDATIDEFKQQLRELRAILGTANTTDTVRKAVRHVHAALTAKDTDHEGDSTHNSGLIPECDRLARPLP